MKTRGQLRFWLMALGAIHLVVMGAGFLAPYDAAEQDRESPYSPPTAVHFVDLDGRLHLRPFFYRRYFEGGSGDQVAKGAGMAVALQFFVQGTPYRLFGVFPSRLHLFGARGGRFYLLGTDAFGRDQFSRILYGGQISLLAGLLGASSTLLLGGVIGAMAGFYGGWTETLLMRLSELVLALPWLYLLFAVRAFLPLNVRPLEAFLLVVVALGAVGWARPARLVRGIVLSVKEREFVRAARGFGASNGYLMRRHILPQAAGALVTQATVLIPQFVLAEITLSFFGLGIPEPLPSWGNLLAALQHYSVLVSYWWMYLPALACVPFLIGYLGLANELRGSTRIEKLSARMGAA